jgi:hypothetical protein
MTLLPIYRKFVDDFFAAIAPVEHAYVHAAFNYIAVKSGDRFVIVYGRVFLNITDLNIPSLSFQSEHIRAGRYTLPELKLDVRGFVDQLLTGKLETPHGDLYFDHADGGRYAASFVPYHPDGLTNQQRFNVLTMMADPVAPLPQPDIDWEIKAASIPYDGLQEIANELSLGAMSGPTATVEIVAFNVAAIDGQNSKVSGTSADLRIMVAKGLAPKRAKIGYRIYVPGTPTRRGVVSGEAIQWSDDGSIRRGQTTVQVPNAAVVNCVASYDGIAQSHLWVGDPEKAQNSRRAVYETFDRKLESLKAAIANASVRGQDARQLEPAVAWLVWMLGFSVAHLGGTPKIRDAADLLAATPAGHFAVIECTTGLLKAENKLALLHARAEAVRKNLAASNNTYQRVLPVIVTSMTAAEVKADIEAAERLGILVIARENLDRAIDRTLVQPNADQTYAEAEQAVSAALAKYQTQPALPFTDSPTPAS